MKSITVEELKAKLDANENIQVIDIREDWEVEQATFGAQHIPMGEIPNHLEDISTDKPVVIHCKSGARSARVVQYLEQNHQFTNLYNLQGGIKDWAAKIDNSLVID